MFETSKDDMLKFDTLSCGAGTIGIAIIPSIAGRADFNEDPYEAQNIELNAVEAWQPSVVVTPMEPFELRMLRLATFGEALEKRGIDWLHLPIPVAGIPSDHLEARWLYFGAALQLRLDRGEKILIHSCHGNDRACLLAARLMADAGTPHEDIIQSLSGKYTNPFKTPVQENYVRSLSLEVRDEPDARRALGCLIGGAIGDAFGYQIEFERLDQITQRFGPAGLHDPLYENGKFLVSDDTQMALFTAEGLLNAGRDGNLDDDSLLIACIRGAYRDWLQTQIGRFDADHTGLLSYEEMWARRAPGVTCVNALNAGGGGSVEKPINNSKGCGGVMRAAPIGLHRQISPERAFRLGVLSAALTHGHPSGYLSAGVMASMIACIRCGHSTIEAIENSRKLLTQWPDHDETLSLLDNAVACSRNSTPQSHPDAISKLGQGWMGHEALAIGVYAALVSSSFVEAIRIGANHDGDSDSTASLAGQIWGAQHGIGGIPLSWAKRLDVLDPVCDIAGGFRSAGGRIPSE